MVRAKERHIRLGKKFNMKVEKVFGGYEWYVYKDRHPYGPYIASGVDSSIEKAKKEAKKATVYALKRMRQTKDIGLKRLRDLK